MSPPRWRGQAGSASCLDLVTTLRGQLAARLELPADWDGASLDRTTIRQERRAIH